VKIKTRICISSPAEEILHSFIQAVLDIGTRVKDAGRILRVLSSSRKQIGRMRGSVKAIIGGLKA